MKLKLDDKGQVVVDNGMPIYVYDDGREAPFDAPGAVGKIKTLADEKEKVSKAHDALAERLKPFDGFDLDGAKTALETVANLKAGELIKAGDVQTIKNETAKAYESQVEALKRQNEELRISGEASVAKLNKELDDLAIGHAIGTSKFVLEGMTLPPNAVRKMWGDNFVRKDGKLVAVVNGKELFSDLKPGEFAEPDEAIELLVKADPYREKYLKGTGAAGSGAHPGAPSGAAGKTMPRKNFESLPVAQQSDFLLKQGGTLTD